MQHDGPYYQLDAMHICEPSPQRTPVLYQAGASPKGRAFAAAHAECVFIAGPSQTTIKSFVADMRARVKAAGRQPEDLKIFSLATPIAGTTTREAQEKFAEYKRYMSHEGALALLSGWLGVDLSELGLDDTLGEVKTEAIQSAVESLTKSGADKRWTVRELAEYAGIGGRSPVFIGSGSDIADQMAAWADDTGVDGFNLAYAVMPETFEDLVDRVVPELQARGRFKTAYREGTLRDKLYGRARLGRDHPAAQYRW